MLKKEEMFCPSTFFILLYNSISIALRIEINNNHSRNFRNLNKFISPDDITK